ncbi:MAG: hypothetical protein HC867_08045, partial [Bacteroidia bacterium]|nr:hypothetical protein [Bacteroidia bacterium]
SKVSHLLDSLRWLAMHYNRKDQTYWVSFKNELVHFDKNFRNLKTYRQGDGYNSPALNFVIDNGGNLWFYNILSQINRLDKTTGTITTLSETDGYKNKIFLV